jgi:SAM-dependent methyltransferase
VSSEKSDRERWEARYRARTLERKTPPAWLMDHLPLLPRRGRALDVAMGLGGTALTLARHGLQVTGLDIAPTAVQQVDCWAREEGLAVEALETDARRYEWPRAAFDVITQFYFLERDLFPRLRDSLKPGGWLLIETASTENIALGGLGPKQEAWCLRPGELEAGFSAYRIHDFRETVLEGPMAVQSIVAQKPEPTRSRA